MAGVQQLQQQIAADADYPRFGGSATASLTSSGLLPASGATTRASLKFSRNARSAAAMSIRMAARSISTATGLVTSAKPSATAIGPITAGVNRINTFAVAFPNELVALMICSLHT
jgi:hypothetical protein